MQVLRIGFDVSVMAAQGARLKVDAPVTEGKRDLAAAIQETAIWLVG